MVILNEAHIASRHRLFLAQLLGALRSDGFTHFAAETFGNASVSPEEGPPRLKAGDPVRQGLGFYTRDPVFAEAVHEALALGYRLVAYEQREDQKAASPSGGVAAREAAQAENFNRALQAWPDGRFLVYVGYSHLAEAMDRKGQAWFALRLKTLAGLDPLTVDQAFPGSFGPYGADNALARAVLARHRPSEPVVVRGRAGQMIGAGPWAPDLAVFHPALPDVAGRPGWLAADPGRRRRSVLLPQPSGAELTIGQAIHAGDPEDAVPADQHVLPPGARRIEFYLRPGRYRIRLERLDGFSPVAEVDV